MRRTAPAIAAAALLALVACVAGTATGKAKRTIDVRPGPNAISRALDRAEDETVLRIHRGQYEEELSIDERVKLVSAGKRRPVIDGECATRATVEALADGVRFRRLKVVGGLATEVDFTGVSGGRANQVVVKDTCDAEYGINVFNTGPIGVVHSRARGFDDAGFYVGGVTSSPGGAVRVRESESLNNHRGVIVEDLAGGEVRVAKNFIHDNRVPFTGSVPTGIFVNRSDGVRIEENDVTRNGIGMHLSPDSDGNAALFNLFADNGVDIRNQGSGNCGSGNSFETGDALPAC